MDKEQLREDIKLILGNDVVNLEIPDESIDRLIEMAFRTVKPYVSQRKMITVTAMPVVNLTSERVLEVLRVYPANVMYSGGAEILFDFQLYRTEKSMRSIESMVERSAYQDVEIGFDFQDGNLYISEGSVIGAVTVEAIVDVTLLELQDERAMAWLQKYSIALTKETLGRIRSKYKSSNLPIELDGETLLNEAQSEKDKLESELADKDFGPSFVLR